MEKNIQHCFNAQAHTYDSAASLQIQIGKNLSRYLPDCAHNILEIGCGTGLFTEVLVSLYPNAKLLTTDIAPKMLEKCQERLGHLSNLQFACLDGEKFFSEERYDLIVSNMSLHWFSEYQKSFSHIMNHLASHGHFVFSMLGSESLLAWKKIYKNYNHPIATPVFPDKEILHTTFPLMDVISEVTLWPYKTAHDFLQSLKKIGATASRKNHVPLSPGTLRKLLRQVSHTLHIDYEVIYGRYTK
jgi:malonyl-CoA O-methyltransferase